MTIRPMKNLLAALCAVMALGACGSLDVPDLNNPSRDDFVQKPTRQAVLSGATGLLLGRRTGIAAQNGYVAELGVLGREAFIFDASDPRFVTELLGPALDPGGPVFGGNFWLSPYANIRNANTVMDALDHVAGMTDAEKESIRGFAKTIQALDFLLVVNTHYDNGAVLEVNRPLGDPLAPIVTDLKNVTYPFIISLLDEGRDHLLHGGTAFPFALSTGFKGFNTPATFIKFNRAVRARVDVYRGDFVQALEDLSGSFLDVRADLALGAYDTFGSGSGELGNSLNGPTMFVHPSLIADADKKANGDLDDRVTRKTKKGAAGSDPDGKVSSDMAFTIYPDSNAPVTIIRNEELILLRAEANIGLKNYPAAADDLNFIRTTSGGLPPRFDITEATALDELLKQKRYSLLFEGGHRWIDLRRYDKLDTLPREYSDAPVHKQFPIPKPEMDGRK
ncbi:RagB/SusD family nutrient uptake outer membrane protein [Corallococcus sp. H22C18031201]|uniref:RagB/SusD family nutrient uptake outer membrane protein n=1 Tax=Citreicoccus inhibens TaxID=2849499 RepID=UPI000E721F9D|nr:RagB/SusD family nutrient uptake outer membrane protein [Citreicoccus inhibens]MBU8899977.1 RagB/SusD family nutrient uptake outer membrane protein [Citreicoccus inhibens]RJS27920.1 RagB/SusD family nutrient uptake outer membrane protein [Corallococcus sp. H22C18031201]